MSGGLAMSQIFSEMSSGKILRNKVNIESTKVGFLIAKFLAERGVDHIFGLVGGHTQDIWMEAARLGIKIIDVRNEQVATQMAYAYAELAGKLGIAMVTSGPGVTNAITGIANAHISRVPILVISGVPPRPQWHMGPLQELPHAEVLKPITRYARTVFHKSHVLRELDEAVACAKGQGNEPGPAYIDFPVDLLRETLPLSAIEQDYFFQREPFHPIPNPQAIDLAADMLLSAKRPLIISGRSARGAEAPLAGLLDALQCVYIDTQESRGLVPDDHPAYMPAMRGRAMVEADVILTIGRRLDGQLAYGSPAVFKNARLIRVGICAAEIRGNRRGDIEICGSAEKILEAILAEAGKRSNSVDKAWVEKMRSANFERRQALLREMAEARPGRDGAMHPYKMLGRIREAVKHDAVIITEGGDILSFARVALTGAGSIYLDAGGFGCLGIGVPFGIAAAIVHPERQVVVVSGDGSFGLTGLDIDTAKRHNARVVFVVANNAAWGIVKNDQIEKYGFAAGADLPSNDYSALARAFGLYAKRVEDPDQLPVALKEAFEQAPALLDVVITLDAVSPDAQNRMQDIWNYQMLGKWDRMERARLNIHEDEIGK